MAHPEQVYEKDFNVKKLTAAQKAKYKKHNLDEFPVAATVVLSIVTFGLFHWIYFGIAHENLPKIQEDDFGAAKAILFMLIPFFNLYWVFIYWLRLYDRVNLQLKMRGINFELPRGLVLASIILGFIPLVSMINFILKPIIVGFMQHGMNLASK